MLNPRIAALAGGFGAMALGGALLLYVIPAYVPAPSFVSARSRVESLIQSSAVMDSR